MSLKTTGPVVDETARGDGPLLRVVDRSPQGRRRCRLMPVCCCCGADWPAAAAGRQRWLSEWLKRDDRRSICSAVASVAPSNHQEWKEPQLGCRKTVREQAATKVLHRLKSIVIGAVNASMAWLLRLGQTGRRPDLYRRAATKPWSSSNQATEAYRMESQQRTPKMLHRTRRRLRARTRAFTTTSDVSLPRYQAGSARQGIAAAGLVVVVWAAAGPCSISRKHGRRSSTRERALRRF